MSTNIQAIELAGYFPKNSEFRLLIDEAFGPGIVDRFKKPAKRSIFTSKPIENELFSRFPGGGDDFEPPEDDDDDNAFREILKVAEIRELLEAWGKSFRKHRHELERALHEHSRQIRAIEKEGFKQKIALEIVSQLMSTIKLIAVAYAIHVLATHPDTLYYEVVTDVDPLNVRSSDDFNSKDNIVGSIERLETVIVIGETERAYKVRCSEITNLKSNSNVDICYVTKKYLRQISFPKE